MKKGYGKWLTGDEMELLGNHITGWAQIIVFIVSAVWAVGKISTTTKMLGTEIRHLSDAVSKLDMILEQTQKEVGVIRERVAVIEAVMYREQNHQ